ncbi:MAG: hypothetical protein PHU14_12255, partial [Methylovulum sp.]|nr:hypothetical protein [Methylovulum sp.]
GLLALGDVVQLPEPELHAIEEALLALPDEQKNALKPVFEQFAGQYPYPILRCVRAALLYRTG